MEKNEREELRNDDIVVRGKIIAAELLTELLMRIDCHKTLGIICPLVCRRWYGLLSSPGFWVQYMHYWSLAVPPPNLRSEPSINIKKVSLKRPFKKNLIKNPSGEKGFEGWTIRVNGGNRFVVENPPIGCASGLDDDIHIAFATSYGWCRKYYVVDLWNEGIQAEFLDKYRPPITVSENFNCRKDCASIYVLDVELVLHGREPSTVSLREDRLENMTTESLIVRIHRMERGTDAEWQYEEYTFTDYPPGIRYVVFEHSGKDLQFWRGHYGSKMAKASVVVHFGNGVPSSAALPKARISQEDNNPSAPSPQ